MVCIAIVLVAISGCGRRAPRATVEGTLRFRGKPLDNCLVTFLPASASETKAPHSRGLTDREGKFRLCCDNQEDGAAVGSHRVTIQDLSVSTGVRRRDHGAADADVDENAPALPVHRSRVPGKYTSPATTPVSKEVKPGHQVIDLDIE
ncbi:MAG: hypothetical protein JW809_13710 [Pirellulales bacterium]|nr:hypothetical protein [Pirellulales bacterium]